MNSYQYLVLLAISSFLNYVFPLVKNTILLFLLSLWFLLGFTRGSSCPAIKCDGSSRLGPRPTSFLTLYSLCLGDLILANDFNYHLCGYTWHFISEPHISTQLQWPIWHFHLDVSKAPQTQSLWKQACHLSSVPHLPGSFLFFLISLNHTLIQLSKPKRSPWTCPLLFPSHV